MNFYWLFKQPNQSLNIIFVRKFKYENVMTILSKIGHPQMGLVKNAPKWVW